MMMLVFMALLTPHPGYHCTKSDLGGLGPGDVNGTAAIVSLDWVTYGMVQLEDCSQDQAGSG